MLQRWLKHSAGCEPNYVGATMDVGWFVLSSDFQRPASLDEPRLAQVQLGVIRSFPYGATFATLSITHCRRAQLWSSNHQRSETV